ncbi:hypothetical protein BG004_000132 [Podila humilis]|nr:hypothetical protein BG004_000132 [Podila humilis]
MSNPMPPPEFKPPQEKEKKEGLSQDDFRKLLATPRAGTSEGGAGGIKGSFSRSLGSANRTARAPQPQTPRSGDNSQKPKPKKSYNKHSNKEGGSSDKAAGSKYRDRATERRQGINPDYVETEQILSTLEDAAADVAPEILYEQSKFLGGDVEHTHLVKGLDFALLNKVRQEDKEKDPTAAAAMDLDSVFEDVEKKVANESEHGVSTSTASKEQQALERLEKPEMHGVLANNVFKYAIEEPLRRPPKVNEMFVPGRTVFVFEVPLTSKVKKSKSNGRVVEDNNPFVVPTTVLRSHADVDQNNGGGGNNVENPESDMVMKKILDVLQAIRTGERKAGELEAELKAKKRAAAAAAAAKLAATRQLEEDRLLAVEPDEDGEDIFADAGRDYVVEPAYKDQPSSSATANNKDEDGPMVGPTIPEVVDMSHYFGEESDEEEDQEQGEGARPEENSSSEAPLLGPSRPSEMDMASYFDEDSDEEASEAEQDEHQQQQQEQQLLLSDKDNTREHYGSLADSSVSGVLSTSSNETTAHTTAPRKAARLHGLEMDEDADYYSAYGLGTGSRHLGHTAYDSDEDDEDGAQQSTILMDQGTHKNKRAQLGRFDFDTEEGFNRYKDTVDVVPKTAFQFGVKMSDGRKTGKWDEGKGKGLSKDEKLDRDWQRISRLMEKNSGGGGGGSGKSGRRDDGASQGGNDGHKRRKNNNW